MVPALFLFFSLASGSLSLLLCRIRCLLRAQLSLCGGGAFVVQILGALFPQSDDAGVFGALLKTTCMFNTYDPIQQAAEGGSQACCVIRVG